MIDPDEVAEPRALERQLARELGERGHIEALHVAEQRRARRPVHEEAHRRGAVLRGRIAQVHRGLRVDEREGGKGDLGDTNNNANRSTADSTSHTDGASTPDMMGTGYNGLPTNIKMEDGGLASIGVKGEHRPPSSSLSGSMSRF